MIMNMLILAQEDQFGMFPEDFMETSPATIPWWVFGVAFLFIGVGVLIYFGWRQYKEKSELNEQHSVFYGICDQLEIDLEDRALLEEIANSEKLVSPLVLLMSGKTLDFHVDKFMSRQPETRHREVKNQVKAVRAKIYE